MNMKKEVYNYLEFSRPCSIRGLIDQQYIVTSAFLLAQKDERRTCDYFQYLDHTVGSSLSLRPQALSLMFGFLKQWIFQKLEIVTTFRAPLIAGAQPEDGVGLSEETEESSLCGG